MAKLVYPVHGGGGSPRSTRANRSPLPACGERARVRGRTKGIPDRGGPRILERLLAITRRPALTGWRPWLPLTPTLSPQAGSLRAFIAAVAIGAAGGAAWAQGPASDAKPYDDKLMRLSEVLGAVHYLRELCGATDGQMWRDRMKELMDMEGSSALRRAKLTRSFNNGYHAYSRTYSTCSQSAQTAINRFLAEGAEIADTLAKTAP
jgi:uncharacterized protein (TIGR02301 family)